MSQDQGVSASPSGLPPASRAEPIVSGRAGIPNAESDEGADPWAGLSELEKDLILARQGDYPGAAGCKRIAAAYDALGTADTTAISFCWTDNEGISDRALALVRSMAALKCKNEYPKGVFGHEARRHYDEARSISRAVVAIAIETQRVETENTGSIAKR